MNILVLLPVNDRHRAILESSAPGEDFIYTSSDAATRKQVADADVILGNIDPDMLTACEHLQLLQLQTAGYDDYLAAGTVPAEAKLSCSIGAYGQAVSEHMFTMVLSMMKRLPGYHDLQREHRWEDLGPVTSLKNANVLVLGAGDIGGHGGVGTLEHFAEGVIEGEADAVLAASVFHFGTFSIREVKEYMASQGIPVRLDF